MAGGGLVDGRRLRPDAELSFRPIPDSSKYMATAVGHHEGFSGSLVMLDTRIPDDGKMSQLKRITPEYAFPEVEGGSHTYGTAWPLSEDFYLCNFNDGLYVLDRFGNREMIYDPGGGPYRVRDPFPLRPRRKPPVIPVMTWQGKREGKSGHTRATISIMNVYAAATAATLPEGKWKGMTSYTRPAALQRPPSRIEPEVDSGAMPFNYIKLVKEPVFDKKCVGCHQKNPKAPDMSYVSLARHSLAFSLPGELGLYRLGVGGSRTTPGKFGAQASGIVKALKTLPQHKDVNLSADDWRRITLWLDMNSNEIGWIGNDDSQIAAQKLGEALWPPVDVDPRNPTGVEKNVPLADAAAYGNAVEKAGADKRPGYQKDRKN